MELQKFQNNLSPIQQALESKKVRESDPADLFRTVTASITKAYADTGQLPTESGLNYLVSETVNELKDLYPSMRVDEIPIAFKNGIREEYGEYFGLNIKSFSFFFKNYLESQKRINAVKELHKAQEPEKPMPTPEETFEAIKQTIKNAYNIFLEKGKYNDIGNFVYNKMDELQLINLNTDAKLLIYEQARTSLFSQNNPELAVNRSEFKSISQNLELLNHPTKSKAMIQQEAKKIALHTVFEDFKQNQVDIDQMIDQENPF